MHRYTWDKTNKKHVEGVDKDRKTGLSLMVSSDGAGNILPYVFTVPGKTFGSLDKFFQHSATHGHEYWGALGPNIKGRERSGMLEAVSRKNGCAMNIGEVCS